MLRSRTAIAILEAALAVKINHFQARKSLPRTKYGEWGVHARGSCRGGRGLLAAAAAVVLAEEPDQVGPHRVCVTYLQVLQHCV